MPDLELNNITKKYGGVIALDDATLQSNKGEIHGLIGQNGAGKSTILKIFAGIVPSDAGNICLYGQPIHFRNSKDAIKSGIGMVFQELSLIPDLKVCQNIFLEAEDQKGLLNSSLRKLRKKSYALFDTMGIDVANPDNNINELSLSQRQMVEIAKVIARDPKVIILDEATSALGKDQVGWLMQYCKKLASEEKIIIYISHKLSEVRSLADRVTVFRNGKNVGTFNVGEKSIDEVIGLMLGRSIGRLYPPQTQDVTREEILGVTNLKSGIHLQNVSFSQYKGEILGIGGVSGQGQEELFSSLFGIRPYQGKISLSGKQIVINHPYEALNQGISLVPEDRSSQGLLLSKPLPFNISLSSIQKISRIGFIQRNNEMRLTHSMIEKLSIMVPNIYNPVETLSGGNQQKVVLAKLLATNPKVLLMFDSTRGVDVGTKAEIYTLLRQLTASGASILWYSTDNDELINMCDRVLVMRQGRIEAELQKELITEENLVRSSVGESVIKGE